MCSVEWYHFIGRKTNRLQAYACDVRVNGGHDEQTHSSTFLRKTDVHLSHAQDTYAYR